MRSTYAAARAMRVDKTGGGSTPPTVEQGLVRALDPDVVVVRALEPDVVRRGCFQVLKMALKKH